MFVYADSKNEQEFLPQQILSKDKKLVIPSSYQEFIESLQDDEIKKIHLVSPDSFKDSIDLNQLADFIIAANNPNSPVISITLNTGNYTSEGWVIFFSKVMRDGKLEFISIDNRNYKEPLIFSIHSVCVVFENAAANKHLKKIAIYGRELTNDLISAAIAKTITNSVSLTDITLDDCILKLDSLSTSLSVTNAPISKLTITNQIFAKSFDGLNDLIKRNGIWILNLSGCVFTAHYAALTFISALRNNKSLIELTLSRIHGNALNALNVQTNCLLSAPANRHTLTRVITNHPKLVKLLGAFLIGNDEAAEFLQEVAGNKLLVEIQLPPLHAGASALNGNVIPGKEYIISQYKSLVEGNKIAAKSLFKEIGFTLFQGARQRNSLRKSPLYSTVVAAKVLTYLFPDFSNETEAKGWICTMNDSISSQRKKLKR
jgi:hypothetical protein